MSEFNDNRQPRRRRTQLNAAQYAGQQTLDNSIPLIRTEDAPMQPTNPPRRNPQPPPAQQSANPPMQPMSAAQPMRPQGMNQPGQGSQYAQSGQMRGFRGVQGTPMQPQQGWNNGVQPLDAAHQLEQFPWGQNPTSMNTGRNQPIRGGQMMPKINMKNIQIAAWRKTRLPLRAFFVFLALTVIFSSANDTFLPPMAVPSLKSNPY